MDIGAFQTGGIDIGAFQTTAIAFDANGSFLLPSFLIGGDADGVATPILSKPFTSEFTTEFTIQ